MHLDSCNALLLGASTFNWPIDGSIVGLYLLATMAAGLLVRKYVGTRGRFSRRRT